MPRVLKKLYQCPRIEFYILTLSISSIIIPCAIAGIIYGFIPTGSNPEYCDWENTVGVMFFTNPIGEVLMTCFHCLLLFTAVDNNLPWRPFKMYAPLLICSYSVQVGLYGILVATGTYTYVSPVYRRGADCSVEGFIIWHYALALLVCCWRWCGWI